MTPLSDFEKALAAKVCGASMQAFSASKRFARDFNAGHTRQLSDKGRGFLAFVAHRYRRQYQLSQEEQAWVKQWIAEWGGRE
jgi:hypothetical protein